VYNSYFSFIYNLAVSDYRSRACEAVLLNHLVEESALQTVFRVLSLILIKLLTFSKLFIIAVVIHKLIFLVIDLSI